MMFRKRVGSYGLGDRLDKAPFPWFGGKADAAPAVWAALGDPAHYIEPFAGSLAVLLKRPHQPNRHYYIETVADTDSLQCNFWRAIQFRPQETAEYASWPVSELDKQARGCFLLKWRESEATARLAGDPTWCDYGPNESRTVAAEVRKWCLEHGDDPKYRIVYAGFDQEGAELVAAGWREVEWFRGGHLKGGMANTARRKGDGPKHQQYRERLWLSPHCLLEAVSKKSRAGFGITGNCDG